MIDYVPGKLAWFEENQPREGKSADETWIGDVADADVPTCGSAPDSASGAGSACSGGLARSGNAVRSISRTQSSSGFP